jgi:hypothetical protein
MNSLWDIRIFLGLVPKESPCIIVRRVLMKFGFRLKLIISRANYV